MLRILRRKEIWRITWNNEEDEKKHATTATTTAVIKWSERAKDSLWMNDGQK